MMAETLVPRRVAVSAHDYDHDKNLGATARSRETASADSRGCQPTVTITTKTPSREAATRTEPYRFSTGKNSRFVGPW